VGFSAIVAVIERLLTQSPTLCLAHTALLVASSAPRHRHLDPEVSIAGSSDDPLLNTVRTRLASGALFLIDGKGRAGRGSGKCWRIRQAHPAFARRGGAALERPPFGLSSFAP
jgi:hypothetical protein